MKEIKLPSEQHKFAVEEIKSYFHSKQEEEISDLAATLLLDFPVATKNLIKSSFSSLIVILMNKSLKLSL